MTHRNSTQTLLVHHAGTPTPTPEMQSGTEIETSLHTSSQLDDDATMTTPRDSLRPQPTRQAHHHSFTQTVHSPERFGRAEDEATMLRDLDQRLHAEQSNPLDHSGIEDPVVGRKSSVLNATAVHDPIATLHAAANATSPTRAAGRIKFHDEPEFDLEMLVAQRNITAVRAHLAELQAALAREKARTTQLTIDAQEMKLAVEVETRRANEAEHATIEVAQRHEQIIAEMTRTHEQTMREASEQHAQAALATEQLVASLRRELATKVDPPSPSELAARVAARRARIQKLALEPVKATIRKTRTCTAEIKAEFASFSHDMNESCKLILGALLANDAAQNAGGLLARYNTEKKQRQKLHDQLLELQGNIRVFARVRPIMGNTARNASGGEKAAHSTLVAQPNEAGRLVTELEQDATRFIDERTLGHSGRVFEFDRVLHQTATQEDVYAQVAPLIQSVVDGKSVVLMAYGQTGSGKTWTMEGNAENPGVNVRALKHLFELLSEKRAEEEEWTVQVKFQAVEIYNDAPRDLLLEPASYKKTMTSNGETAKPLEIHQTAEGNIVIPGLTEKYVTSADEVTALIHSHIKVNRSTAATSMNEYSSRSHSLLFLHVDLVQRSTDERFSGRLILIDLAGSERMKTSEATGVTAKEAVHINKSLSALGDVIAALKTKATHVPFRHSKLTYLLSDALSPTAPSAAKVLMFAQISPSVSDAAESACTLQFASRVRTVQLGAAKPKKASAPKKDVVGKLLKAESALSEKDGQVNSALAEARALREALDAERARVATMRDDEARKKAHLEHLLRLKDRELSELKAQREATARLAAARSTIMSPNSKEGSAAAAAAVASFASPNASPMPSMVASSPNESMTIGIAPIPLSFDDALPIGATVANDLVVQDLDDDIDMADAAEDKENGATAPVTSRRLSGNKRKDSPLKSTTGEPTPITTTMSQPAMKKSKLAQPTLLSPVKPLGANQQAINTSVHVTSVGSLFKKVSNAATRAAGPGSARLPATPARNTGAKSKVAAAWKTVAEEPSASYAECLMSPVPSANSHGKTISFGPVQTKFISPSPPTHRLGTCEPQSIASLTTSASQTAPSSALATLAANLDAFRAKRAAAAQSLAGRTTGLLGGAKRQPAQPKAPSALSTPAWSSNTRCK